ncbi:uncharacterized protein LOC131670845 [Phymastichus coffea]|uniref:uncharacterized protein LOC131670845 n=1 Tax=Phymastichus coffea TaxID=108790 RepID=UPI00273A9F1E|nr:uncharacterized protein LOC131670845 [Phymastichus coffea]
MVAEKLIRKEPKEFSIEDNVIVGHPRKSTDSRGVARILWESFSEAPDFVAQTNADTGENTTFAELKDRSARCALWLREQGIGKDDVISISTPNQTDDLVPYIATLFVGAIVNPWYHDLTEANARRFFQTYQPKVMFACEQSIDQLARIANSEGMSCSFVVYGKHAEYPSLRDLLAERSQEEVASFEYAEPVDPWTQCGIILFSSGTTGTPKGAMLSYKAIGSFDMLDDSMSLQQQNYLWYSSLSWVTGAFLLLNCIVMRTTRIIHGEFDPDKSSRVIEKYKVKRVLWTPSVLIQCCKAKVFARYDYSSLEILCTGGSKLGETILEEAQRALPHCFVKNGYGMTELSGLAVLQTHDRKKIDAIGYAIRGVKLKIIDSDTGRTLGPNQQGEICVHKPTAFLGYYNNPEETAKTLDKEGWVHTGDLGYYDEDGEIMLTDRIKVLIITKNYHVAPSEIEDILLRHPGVKDCAVIPVPHDVDIERPFAFVVKQPGATVTTEELIEMPAAIDEYYRLTGGIAFVDHLVYTSTGKKSFQVLKEKAKEYLVGR